MRIKEKLYNLLGKEEKENCNTALFDSCSNDSSTEQTAFETQLNSSEEKDGFFKKILIKIKDFIANGPKIVSIRPAKYFITPKITEIKFNIRSTYEFDATISIIGKRNKKEYFADFSSFIKGKSEYILNKSDLGEDLSTGEYSLLLKDTSSKVIAKSNFWVISSEKNETPLLERLIRGDRTNMVMGTNQNSIVKNVLMNFDIFGKETPVFSISRVPSELTVSAEIGESCFATQEGTDKFSVDSKDLDTSFFRKTGRIINYLNSNQTLSQEEIFSRERNTLAETLNLESDEEVITYSDVTQMNALGYIQIKPAFVKITATKTDSLAPGYYPCDVDAKLLFSFKKQTIKLGFNIVQGDTPLLVDDGTDFPLSAPALSEDAIMSEDQYNAAASELFTREVYTEANGFLAGWDDHLWLNNSETAKLQAAARGSILIVIIGNTECSYTRKAMEIFSSAEFEDSTKDALATILFFPNATQNVEAMPYMTGLITFPMVKVYNVLPTSWSGATEVYSYSSTLMGEFTFRPDYLGRKKVLSRNGVVGISNNYDCSQYNMPVNFSTEGFMDLVTKSMNGSFMRISVPCSSFD